ncbi:MAG: sensor histidine kinase [Minisyncoccota bacterium]
MSVISFANVIFSDTLPLILFSTSVFVLVLTFGINLIRGVLREVEQREKIQKLADELEEINERQKGLIRFISHEVKGFLTKDASVFAALVEGDFGALPEEMKPIVNQALAQSRDGVRSAEDILKASNQKKGTTEYKKESFDLKTLAEEAVEKSRMLAEGKKLVLSFTAEDADAPYTIVGDRNEIGDHVLRNLIDNSINYTPSGSIAVSLKKENGKIVFSVKDTGIGITEEDKKHLFTEGGHGKDSQKVNVHSTGYGLYIAKNIVTAHGGTIRAESEGEGKGSTFVVELPA